MELEELTQEGRDELVARLDIQIKKMGDVMHASVFTRLRADELGDLDPDIRADLVKINELVADAHALAYKHRERLAVDAPSDGQEEGLA